jgi:hypothetical protein
MTRFLQSKTVMAALVAAIHDLHASRCSWVAGTSPAMTSFNFAVEREA